MCARGAPREELTAAPEFIRAGRSKLFLIRLPLTLQLHVTPLHLAEGPPAAPGCVFPRLTCPLSSHVLQRSEHICTRIHVRLARQTRLLEPVNLPRFGSLHLGADRCLHCREVCKRTCWWPSLSFDGNKHWRSESLAAVFDPLTSHRVLSSLETRPFRQKHWSCCPCSGDGRAQSQVQLGPNFLVPIFIWRLKPSILWSHKFIFDFRG